MLLQQLMGMFVPNDAGVCPCIRRVCVVSTVVNIQGVGVAISEQ